MSSPRTTVAIIELVLYPLALGLITSVLTKHVSRADRSWLPVCLPLLVLATLRIAGAVLVLSSGPSSDDDDDDAGSSPPPHAAAVLDDVAAAPLLMAVAGMLLRINGPLPHGLPVYAIVPLQALTVLGAILTSVGNRTALATHRGSGAAQAGAGIFLAVLAALLVLGAVTYGKTTTSTSSPPSPSPTDRDSAVGVLVLGPTAATRVAWSLVAAVRVGAQTMLDDVWLHFVMVVVAEAVVAGTFIAIGLGSRRAKKTTTGFRVLETGGGGEEAAALLMRRGGGGGGIGRPGTPDYHRNSNALDPKLRPLVLQGGDIHDSRTWGPLY
ncbi:hypothetical protein F4780DRAFT_797699 [Xylariomycetidae sp. FL0641]|nr:hypothetical protein F4780DRAFT_797699 [Xylariomycetidae sp. FL0641]